MEIYANECDFMYNNANKRSSWARLLRFNFLSSRLPPTLSAIAHWGWNAMFITAGKMTCIGNKACTSNQSRMCTIGSYYSESIRLCIWKAVLGFTSTHFVLLLFQPWSSVKCVLRDVNTCIRRVLIITWFNYITLVVNCTSANQKVISVYYLKTYSKRQ